MWKPDPVFTGLISHEEIKSMTTDRADGTFIVSNKSNQLVFQQRKRIQVTTKCSMGEQFGNFPFDTHR